jgi:hypothetical protein
MVSMPCLTVLVPMAPSTGACCSALLSDTPPECPDPQKVSRWVSCLPASVPAGVLIPHVECTALYLPRVGGHSPCCPCMVHQQTAYPGNVAWNSFSLRHLQFSLLCFQLGQALTELSQTNFSRGVCASQPWQHTWAAPQSCTMGPVHLSRLAEIGDVCRPGCVCLSTEGGASACLLVPLCQPCNREHNHDWDAPEPGIRTDVIRGSLPRPLCCVEPDRSRHPLRSSPALCMGRSCI